MAVHLGKRELEGYRDSAIRATAYYEKLSARRTFGQDANTYGNQSGR
jgi:hypothetical protein